jgi:hypothetical protein
VRLQVRLILSFWLVLTAVLCCAQETSDSARKRPHSERVFQFADPDLLPEDVVYDEQANRFYVSSVRRRTVLSCDTKGKCEPLLKAKGHALYSMMSMSLSDGLNRRLWVLTASTNAEENHRADDKGKSALLSIEIYNGMIFERLEPPDGAHSLGDMTSAKDGTLYISDGQSGDLFFLRPGSDQLERLLPHGTFRSPQTPALNSDESILFVPDYSKGIAIVRLKDRSVEWISSADDLRGIDGLYFYKNSLIAIQNGTNPKQIVRLQLNKQFNISKREILDAGSSRLGEPTHGLIRHDSFYFLAHTGWDRITDNGTMTPGQPAEIRRLPLR